MFSRQAALVSRLVLSVCHFVRPLAYVYGPLRIWSDCCLMLDEGEGKYVSLPTSWGKSYNCLVFKSNVHNPPSLAHNSGQVDYRINPVNVHIPVRAGSS